MKFHVLFATLIFSCSGSQSKLEVDTDTMPSQARIATDNTPSDTFGLWSVDYIMGKFDPAEDTSFTIIDQEHADREGLYLRKDTYQAFNNMYQAANHENIKLVIRSATRNFDYQKQIWENKWRGNTPLESTVKATSIANESLRAIEILKYSSMPGSSRHHWGTDIDLNAFTNQYFEKGEGLRIYQWLLAHAPSFGFCQPYTEKGPARPQGYEEEKWHWSYLPISLPLTKSAQMMLNDSMITGFLGSEQAIKIGVVQNYVLSIDSSCYLPNVQSGTISN